MRTTCRLTLGILVLVAAAGVAFAQQPDPPPTLPPLPPAQVTPAPPVPEAMPAEEQVTSTPVLVLVPIAPDLVVTAAPRPVHKPSSPRAKKPALATASKKPIEKPATPESSSQAKEGAAAASVTVSGDSSTPPPPGAAGTADVPASTASADLSPKAPPSVDPAVQAAIDKKLADDAQSKRNVGGLIVLGLGALALIGLAVFFVRSRKSGSNTVPPIFEGGGPAIVAVAAVASGSDGRSRLEP